MRRLKISIHDYVPTFQFQLGAKARQSNTETFSKKEINARYIKSFWGLMILFNASAVNLMVKQQIKSNIRLIKKIFHPGHIQTKDTSSQ